MAKPAVFLDRDNTLVEDPGYNSDPKRARLLPGVPEALERLEAKGFVLVVVTNQSGVARGYYDEAAVEAVHDVIQKGVGGRITRFVHCPHLPEGIVPQYSIECDCRKPKPGMIRRAAKDLDIDTARSFLVGDALRDVIAGRSAGVRTVLLRSGPDPAPEEADHVAPGLTEAVDWILKNTS